MKRIVLLFFGISLCGLIPTAHAGTAAPVPALSTPDVVSDNHGDSWIILLNSQADVSGAATVRGKEKKAEYVFGKLVAVAEASQRQLTEQLTAMGIDFRPFYVVNMIEARLTPQQISLIRQWDEVAAIIPNGVYRMETPVDMQPYVHDGLRNDVTWGLEKINVPQVWNLGITGSGAVVGGQDTGYEWDHPSLVESYRGAQGSAVDHNYHWHDAIHELNPLNGGLANPCGLSSPAPCDDHNHGTHTMGTVTGNNSPGPEFGMAPSATWMACRNMEQGWGMFSTYMECFEFFLAPWDLNGENPDPAMAPHVMVNSWGCPEQELCHPGNWNLMNLAIQNLKASGIVVVVSAGNNGNSCGSVIYPAGMLEESFSVGATNANDTIANFSSRGPVVVDESYRIKPDVSAPGVAVLSAIREGSFAVYSGTSMAGPHVAGAVALMISANPQLAGEVETIEQILQETAVILSTQQECNGVPGTTIPNNTYGHGRIDVLAAVQKALEFTHVENLQQLTAFRLFPNPSLSGFTVSSAENFPGPEIWHVTVFDLAGRLYYSDSYLQGYLIDAGTWPAGLYLVRITSGEHVETLRWIKAG